MAEACQFPALLATLLHTHNLRPPPFLLFPLSCVHVSGRCGLSSSGDCGAVSLFSLRICSSTHHPAASGSPPADRWWPGPSYLSSQQALASLQRVPTPLTALPDNLPVWVVKCRRIIIMLCWVMFHKVAKCRGV